MATKKRVTRRVRRVVRKAVRRVRRVVRHSAPSRRKRTVHQKFNAIKEQLNKQLKELLFKRDQATTYKQHRAAQSKIDEVRKQLRRCG